jgi:hypothetical protein
MKRILATVVTLAIAAAVAQAWTMPSTSQIEAAAGNPSLLPGLLQGASDEQAADLIVAVLEKAAASNPGNVTQIITQAMRGRSVDSARAVAEHVGMHLGQMATVPAIAAIKGTVQSAFVALPQIGNAAGVAYTNAYNAAAMVISTTAGVPKENLLLPPVVVGYQETGA